MKNEQQNEEFDRLRVENEKKKKKLIEDYGAFFPEMSGENDFSPELENEFLNQILAFEESSQDVKYVTLYDFLGEPMFRPLDKLKDSEIHNELNRLIKLMDDHHVCVDTICEVPEKELYRFITEELLFEEKEDIRIPGMISHYIYEEFHPNHEHDIRTQSYDFIIAYLDNKNDFYTNLLTDEALEKDWHLHFRKAFIYFSIHNFSISKLNHDIEKATVKFDCDFTGKIDSSSELFRFNGQGEMTLLYQWDYWCVDTINLPKGSILK